MRILGTVWVGTRGIHRKENGKANEPREARPDPTQDLAEQPAKPAEDVSRKIESVRADTKAAAKTAGSISKLINQVNDFYSTRAGAFAEQHATNAMCRNVSDSVRRFSEIAKIVGGVPEAARPTTHGTNDPHPLYGNLRKWATN